MNVVIRGLRRQVIDRPLKLGEHDVPSIELDLRSRDEVPHILRGLHYIHTTAEVRVEVFAILSDAHPERVNGGEGEVSADTGQPGKAQWKSAVLGARRLGLNAEYDRILERCNQHTTIRQMLGYGD